MPISQINISSDNVQIRDVALRVGHVDLEVAHKASNYSPPVKQWKKRGLHFGLWDSELCLQVGQILSNRYHHDDKLKLIHELIWGWLGRGDTMIHISDGDSPHDFDVYLKVKNR